MAAVATAIRTATEIRANKGDAVQSNNGYLLKKKDSLADQEDRSMMARAAEGIGKENGISQEKRNEFLKNDLSDAPQNVASAEEKPYVMKIVWFNAIGFLILHLAAIYGMYLSVTSAKVLTVIWSMACAYASALATTMGAHRLYTHRTFKANKWIRLALVLWQTVAGQNCLWVWIRDHRQHHKYSDTNGDPHNASRGFFFSHIGWLMVRKHPDVIRKGKTIDMSDINQDPFVMFQKKYYKTLFTIFAIGFPTAVPCLLWGESWWNSFFISFVMRLITSLNFTWLVNSAAHIYGYRPFSKDILPAENWFVSFFGLGEGWHNYHHTFPWDYRAAEFGQHFNVTTTVIDYCAKMGWVTDVKCASQEMVKRTATKKGDGTHPVYGKESTEETHDY